MCLKKEKKPGPQKAQKKDAKNQNKCALKLKN
jgi:hypothetical protein